MSLPGLNHQSVEGLLNGRPATWCWSADLCCPSSTEVLEPVTASPMSEKSEC